MSSRGCFPQKSLETLNLQRGRRTDLSKTSAQQFLYHPESNLVVLTVQNTSDRDGTVTADLSRVKFDHLVLLTSHNNEEVMQQFEFLSSGGIVEFSKQYLDRQ